MKNLQQDQILDSDQNNLIIYQSNDGDISFNVKILDETIWLTQKQMAELFDKNRRTVNEHIGNIFKENELQEEVVCRKFRHTTQHGAIKGLEQNVNVKYYNLDVIISVGYRVKSQRGTQFRQWATKILRSYMMNGYAINEDKIRSIIKEEVGELKNAISLELKDEVKEIYKNLLEIANRPITINNQISLVSNKLEDKAIELIDELIKETKKENSDNDNNSKLTTELEEIKLDLKTLPKTQKSKDKIFNFFNKLGDDESDLIPIPNFKVILN
ncbi:virulence RhuM family protein [Rickettsiales bacterium]|nr:virulence RhuM family protein [Rickettsiales bacterium]